MLERHHENMRRGGMLLLLQSASSLAECSSRKGGVATAMGRHTLRNESSRSLPSVSSMPQRASPDNVALFTSIGGSRRVAAAVTRTEMVADKRKGGGKMRWLLRRLPGAKR